MARKSAKTVVEFPRFTELPPEIRLMIWRYSLPSTRTVAFDYRPRTNTKTMFRVNHDIFIRDPLNHLSTCRESRQECLKRYSLYLHTNEIYCAPVAIWVGADTDVFKFDSVLNLFDPNPFFKLKDM